MQKFECKGYGDCCRDLKQKFSAERTGKMTQMDVLLLVPKPENIGLPVLDWEIENLQERADKTGKYISRSPLWIFVSNKEEAVVVSWNISHDQCPFLLDNKCSAYGVRPIICRAFPVVNSGLLDLALGREKANVNFSNKCRCWTEAVDPLGEMKTDDMYKHFYNIFGDSYLAALKSDLYILFVGGLLQELANRGKVKSTYLNDKQKENLLRKGTIGFVDFAVREKVLTPEGLNKELEKIDETARKLVGI